MKNVNELTREIISSEFRSSFFRNMQILPNPDKIFRTTGKSYTAYRELKNDPHVWSCIQSRKSGLLSKDYKISGNNTKICRRIEKMLESLDITELMRDILEAPLFGFQPFEIVWGFHKGRRSSIYPENITAKPQEWFAYDQRGRLRFLKEDEPEGTLLPPMKIINVRYEPSVTNPYGESLLAKSYWPVTFKKGSLRFWVNFTERYGMPFLIGRYMRGATDAEAEKLASELAGMTEDAVIVTPSDIELDMKEPLRFSSVSLYKEMIRQCNAEISKAILSQTLTTELDMGSYAASQTHFKIRKEVIMADTKLVEDFFNTLIKWVCMLNFSDKEYPAFKIISDEQDESIRAERDERLMRAGAKFNKHYFFNNYGIKYEELD